MTVVGSRFFMSQKILSKENRKMVWVLTFLVFPNGKSSLTLVYGFFFCWGGEEGERAEEKKAARTCYVLCYSHFPPFFVLSNVNLRIRV